MISYSSLKQQKLHGLLLCRGGYSKDEVSSSLDEKDRFDDSDV